MNTRIALAAPVLALGGVLALAGCSAYDGFVHKHTTAMYDNLEALEDGGLVDADWLPADAAEIVVRASILDEAEDAVVMISSNTPPGENCTEVERHSAPAWVLEGAPDPYAVKTVFSCDDWSVMETNDGWYGWTPNAAEERSAAGK